MPFSVPDHARQEAVSICHFHTPSPLRGTPSILEGELMNRTQDIDCQCSLTPPLR